MTQFESYKDFIRSRGHRLTLSEILSTNYAAEYRRLDAELREEKWEIDLTLNRRSPGQNLRVFREPVVFQNGQGQLL